MKKHCSKCGEEFECCNEKRGCWCEDLSIKHENLQHLRKKYDNCLCRACLSSYSEEALKSG